MTPNFTVPALAGLGAIAVALALPQPAIALSYNPTGTVLINSGLSAPAGLALDGTSLLITNYDSNTVARYSNAGVSQGNFISSGLNGPWGIARNGSETFVASFAGNTIGRYDSSGTLLSSISADRPSNLAITSGGNLFVSSLTNNKVYRFDSSGAALGEFNTGNSPRGVAIDTTGNLLVATGDGQITRYSPTGTVLGTFASGFANPNNILVSSGGEVFIAGGGSDRISRFDSSGTLLQTLGSTGDYRAMAIDGNGSLLALNGSSVMRFDTVQVPFAFSPLWGLLSIALRQLQRRRAIAVPTSD
jgi:sugar lactone lactonase YvrE